MPKESPRSSNSSSASARSSLRMTRSHGQSSARSFRSAPEDIADMDFSVDADVIERIQSRASISSDVHQLMALREKYKEGFYRLDKNDERDPHNWTLNRRLFHQVLFGVAILLSYATASIFAALVHRDVADHGVEVGVLAFSVFLLGNAVGPCIFSPLCSMFGRLVSIYVPLAITGLLLCVCANIEYTSALVVYRFLAGVMASGPLCSLRGASADIWLTQTALGRAHEVAVIWSTFCIVLGSTGAPVFGALLVETSRGYGWRWAAWLVGLLSLSVSIVCMLVLNDTYLPVIEQRACRDKRLDTGFWGLHSEHDSYEFEFPSVSRDNLRTLLVVFHPCALPPILLTSFNFGVLFLLITAAPDQLQLMHRGMSFRASYAALLAIPIGFLVTCWFNIIMARPRRAREWYTRMHHSSSGIPSVAMKPETQLGGLLWLGWLLPAGLFMFGWSLYRDVHWIVPLIGMALVGGGFSVNVRGCHFYLHDAYPGYFQLTSSTCLTVQSIFAGVFPLFARQLFSALNAHWGASLLAFIGIALYAAVGVLAIWGDKIRRIDSAATHTS